MSAASTVQADGGLSASQVQALANLSGSIATAAGLPTLVTRLAQGLSWLLDFDQLALAMRGGDGRTWALIRPRLAAGPEPSWLELEERDSPFEECLRTGRSTRPAGRTSHLLPPGLEATSPIRDLSAFPSALCVPIRGPQGPLGALGTFSSRPGVYQAFEQNLLHVVGLVVEATARKLVLVDELARAEQELVRVGRLRYELTRMVVQDVQAPLAAFESKLDFLQGAVLPAEAVEAKEVVDELRAESRDLAQMVATLNDVARLEEGLVTLERREISLGAFLQERVARAQQSAKAAQISLVSRVDPPRATFLLEAELIARVLDELVLGSLRHTPKRGQVALVARLDGSGLSLVVGDTGPALPPEQRDRLFTKYGRLVGDGELVRPGRALGHHFCRLVVELHGGRIAAADGPGGSTLFRITLPQGAS